MTAKGTARTQVSWSWCGAHSFTCRVCNRPLPQHAPEQPVRSLRLAPQWWVNTGGGGSCSMAKGSPGSQITNKYKLMTQLSRPIRLHKRKITGLFGPNDIRLIYQYSLRDTGEITTRIRLFHTPSRQLEALGHRGQPASEHGPERKLLGPGRWGGGYRGLCAGQLELGSELRFCHTGMGTTPGAQLLHIRKSTCAPNTARHSGTQSVLKPHKPMR